MLNQYDKEYLIQCLQEGIDIPNEYKYTLFPTVQKEYELAYAGKMRKEDVFSDTDEISNLPLQIERTYNGTEHTSKFDDWKNMLIFGDNLQILKTIYYDKDPIIANKIKGKVKLIYIDPPFGTGDEYDGNKGQSAYSAKRKGADFVEFIRRRLLMAYEILADDGVIFVRQGYNFGHYIKIILDEVFGKGNFINEIIVNRGKQRLGGTRKYSTATDSLFVYSKSSNYTFTPFKRPRYKGEATGTNMLMKGERKPPERTFSDPNGEEVVLLPPPNQHWKFVQSKVDDMYRKDVIYLAKSRDGVGSGIRKVVNGEEIPVDYSPSFKFDEDKTIDTNWTDISGYSQDTGYPTENSEDLLKRVIMTASQAGDIVLDFFGGSGTTAVVAEKLDRRWITCDIGKLSYYTIQKRLLEISKSKDMIDPKKKYGKNASAFSVVSAGLYDLGKVFSLSEEKYKAFVKNLFDIDDIDKNNINGVSIDGEKRGYFVKIYPYWDEEMRDADIDEKYIEELHRNIGSRLKNRFYIVAPANSVALVNDYYEVDGIKYYFLKIPYQVIRELHNKNFKKIRQPQSINQINDLDEAVGFHFIRQPEVESSLVSKDGKLYVELKKFISDYNIDETGKEIGNFESLAMVLIDNNYKGSFVMKDYFFAKDLIPKNKKKHDEQEDLSEEIRYELKKASAINIPIQNTGNGKAMVIYIDIYGNEFKETFELGVK